MGTILKVEKLVKKFGSLKAVDNISFEVPEKSITLLIGPNGSGKTTLLNCIAGIYKPDEGKIWFNGKDITGKQPHEIANMGVMKTFQIPAAFSRLSLAENLLIFYRKNPGERLINSLFRKKWIEEEKAATQKLFKTVQTLEIESQLNRRANELSGGQLKLLEYSKLLMADPTLCLLDEPVGSINPVLANKIFSYITEARNDMGKTFIIVEHRLDIAVKYVDYIYVLVNGKILCEGVPEEVLKRKELYEVYLSPLPA
ncbi:MAG: ABC transporter ATP-binding protein [Nitrososphaeria archaeon]|nr:ABC transporter ATP-binding protein [Nitrososphaeria archaeon]